MSCVRLGLPILEKVVLAKFGEKRRKLYWVALISEAAGREPPFTKRSPTCPEMSLTVNLNLCPGRHSGQEESLLASQRWQLSYVGSVSPLQCGEASSLPVNDRRW